MYRDANGKFISAEEYNRQRNKKDDTKIQHETAGETAAEFNEATAEASRGYGYFSRLLNKPFDTLEELVAAENARREELAAKEDQKTRRKQDAELVGEAYKTLTSIKASTAKTIADARKQCALEFEEVRKKWSAVIEEADIAAAEAERLFHEALDTFLERYPEGYHLTLRGDNDETLTIDTRTLDTVDMFNDIFNQFFRMF